MPTAIYHITHIRNLPSIINSGGLIANSILFQRQSNYINISHATIQTRRANTLVPCGAKGTLHDYVPFYFAPRSPMLYSIHRGNVEGYQQGQTPIIHLVTEAEIIKSSNISFVFTDGHAIMEYSDFYDDLNNLQVIDWNVMQSKYWSDTQTDPDRKRRRSAEFLIYHLCPWALIKTIGVINRDIKTQVEQILQTLPHQPPVKICVDWYY